MLESDLIRWLRDRLPKHSQLELGLGDDAAIVRLSQDPRCVLTTDMLMDGVDFRLSEIAPEKAGRKALAVNLSDLAAMAARPVAALVALALPNEGGLLLAQRLYEGLIPLAEQFDVAIAGGDTNSWNGPLVINITLVGETAAEGPLLRGGARPGDAIVVTGSYGGSILSRHFDFIPRVRESLRLRSRYPLHAGIDVSDGLSLDLSRMAEESGCGAVLDLDQIPISADAQRWAQQCGDRSTALDHALGDGEDFELILAVPPETAEAMLRERPLDCPLSRIGSFVARRGLWQRAASGSLEPLSPRGYQHTL
jgi:thiamine-monophosphate kinase